MSGLNPGTYLHGRFEWLRGSLLCRRDTPITSAWAAIGWWEARRIPFNLIEYDRSLSISWSPDSHLFFVNDASGSTETRCYVYDPATLKETDLARVVLTGDPDAAQFLNAGHSYLEAKQWVNSHELLVLLEGHNDGAPPGSFTLRYRVDLSGTVRKLSQHSEQ